MIKVESNMLILDTSFSKQDAEAINHFVEIARVAERDRIIKLLEHEMNHSQFPESPCVRCGVIALIKGENK